MIPQSSSQPAHQKCTASRSESLLKTAVRRMVHTKIDLLLGYEALMPKTEGVVCEVSFLKLSLGRHFKALPQAE